MHQPGRENPGQQNEREEKQIIRERGDAARHRDELEPKPEQESQQPGKGERQDIPREEHRDV